MCVLSGTVLLCCAPAMRPPEVTLETTEGSNVDNGDEQRIKRSPLTADRGWISEQMPLSVHAELGQGVSMLPGSLRGFAVERDVARTTTSHENAVTYDLKLIDSYKELAKSLRLDVRASFKGAAGSASASMSLFQSSKFSSRKVYVLVTMRVLNGSKALTDFKLTDNAVAFPRFGGQFDYAA
jgi:hypothetical protein